MQPEINIFGVSIKTFGLAFGLGFLLAGLICGKRLRELGKPGDWAYEMVFAALIGGLIGARGWWAIGNVDEVRHDVIGGLFGGSGLVWYGGAIGGAIAVLLWAWRKDMFNVTLLDICAVPLTMGYATGRIGCQISGDGDYGKAWDGPWAMAYPHGVVPTTQTVHPTPVYETVVMSMIAIVLWHLRDRLAPGRLFALYLVLAGAERFLVEFLRRNPDVAIGLTLAQFVSLGMIIAGTVWLARTAPPRLKPAY